jgi:hypothetical protein
MSTTSNQPLATKDMVISYCAIRRAIGYIAITFTPILSLGALILGDCHCLKDSASGYYYTCMYPWFIGALCAVGLFLFCYKGYDRRDDVVTNVAALFALGIVFFPTDESTTCACLNVLKRDPNPFFDTAHYVSAGIFFVLMAYMSLFLFTKSGPQPTPQKLKRNKVYKACGYTMLVAMALIPCLLIPGIPQSFLNYRPEFWFESLVLIPFGISWLVKGEGLLKDK